MQNFLHVADTARVLAVAACILAALLTLWLFFREKKTKVLVLCGPQGSGKTSLLVSSVSDAPVETCTSIRSNTCKLSDGRLIVDTPGHPRVSEMELQAHLRRYAGYDVSYVITLGATTSLRESNLMEIGETIVNALAYAAAHAERSGSRVRVIFWITKSDLLDPTLPVYALSWGKPSDKAATKGLAVLTRIKGLVERELQRRQKLALGSGRASLEGLDQISARRGFFKKTNVDVNLSSLVEAMRLRVLDTDGPFQWDKVDWAHVDWVLASKRDVSGSRDILMCI